MLKEATFEDAKELAQKLNLNKELVWKIVEGKKYASLTDMAMTVQQALSVPVHQHR